jgi:Coenzyme PQQ synthesis protein D (PqqD)
MTSFPRAEVDGLVALNVAGALIVQTLDGSERACLDELAGLVWRLADGETSVEKITHKLSTEFGVVADNEAVWAALDRLADADLIFERMTPPSGSIALSRGRDVQMGVEKGPVKASILSAAASTGSGDMDEQIQKGAERLDKEVKGKEDQMKEAGGKESEAKERLGKEAEQLMKGKNN